MAVLERFYLVPLLHCASDQIKRIERHTVRLTHFAVVVAGSAATGTGRSARPGGIFAVLVAGCSCGPDAGSSTTAGTVAAGVGIGTCVTGRAGGAEVITVGGPDVDAGTAV